MPKISRNLVLGAKDAESRETNSFHLIFPMHLVMVPFFRGFPAPVESLPGLKGSQETR